MRSRIADEIRREQEREIGSRDGAQLLASALALGERAIADYMKNFLVSRTAAVRILRKRGQAGRRYSACLDEDAHAGSDRGSR